MNNDKAREFFSDYYEGSIDGGLRQALEQKLRTDAGLKADYSAFEETMRELDSLQHEEIDIPMSLRDRISTRVEEAGVVGKSGSSVFSWLKGFAVAGLAVAAIAVAVISLQKPADPSDVAVGSMGPSSTSVNVDQLDFESDGPKVDLIYKPTSPKTVIVSSAVSGDELKRWNLNGSTLKSPLTNPLDGPAILSVEIVGDPNKTLVALPGRMRTKEKTGSGQLNDLATAIAGYYGVPVLVKSSTTAAVAWDFNKVDAREAASHAVSGETLSVDQKASGLLVIRSN